MTPKEQDDAMEEYKRTFNIKEIPVWSFRRATNNYEFHELMEAIFKAGVEWQRLPNKNLHKPGITQIVDSIKNAPQNIEDLNAFCEKLNEGYMPTVQYRPAKYLVFEDNCIYINGNWDGIKQKMIWDNVIVVNFPYDEIGLGGECPGKLGAPTFTWDEFSRLFTLNWSTEPSQESKYRKPLKARKEPEKDIAGILDDWHDKY